MALKKSLTEPLVKTTNVVIPNRMRIMFGWNEDTGEVDILGADISVEFGSVSTVSGRYILEQTLKKNLYIEQARLESLTPTQVTYLEGVVERLMRFAAEKEGLTLS